MEKHAVSKMIGSPPGYVGYDEGGQLTEIIRRKPYSVILFDEIEKAHPDTFNMLLQILDDGRLTDAKGRKVNFKNTVIIMTSNVGSDILLNSGKELGSIGFSDGSIARAGEDSETKERLTSLLKEQFRPEFLNRVDEIITFHSLTEGEIADIVELQLKRVAARLKREKGVELTVSAPAKKLLAEKGYDPAFGARPLKRVIQTMILNPLAMKIVKGEVKEGQEIIIGASNGEIIIK